VEETAAAGPPKGLGGTAGKTRKAARIEFVPLKGGDEHFPRRLAGIGEFDRVTGGGLVPGSATLVGGDPGIGQSTLLMQVICRLSKNFRTAYISGEEAVEQVRLRAARLGLADSACELAAETSIRDIVAAISHGDAPEILIIDSIQTMYVDT